MKERVTNSNEMLNAFIDDELDEAERQELLTAQVEDQELAETVCELRIIKDMVRAARPKDESLNINARLPRQRYFGKLLAAASIAMILVSILMGTGLDNNTEIIISQQTTDTYSDVSELIVAQQESPKLKLVLHLTRANDKAAMRLFEQIDELLEYSKTKNRYIHVQVIASGQGIRILQQGETAYQDSIKRISTEYDSVDFVACQRSISRLTMREQPVIRVVPEALVTTSGPELIKRRQKQGWATIVI